MNFELVDAIERLFLQAVFDILYIDMFLFQPVLEILPADI